jgi:hypothetical protein
MGGHLIMMAGGPFKVIWGYGGTADTLAAFDRGEITAVRCGEPSIIRLFPEWVENQRLAPLFHQGGIPQADDLAWFKTIGADGPPPYVLDLPGIPYTEDQRQAFENAREVAATYSNSWYLPPGTPEIVYRTWVRAFKAALSDPQLIEAGLVGSVEFNYGDPEILVPHYETVRGLPPSAVAIFKELVGS